MKRIAIISLLSLLIFIVVPQAHADTENTNFPKWMKELHIKINQLFQMQARASSVKEPDRIDQTKYFSFALMGNGKLEKVPDPFGQMDKLFLSESWKANERYQADGHGSSLFAYEKGKYFCLISILIDFRK